MLTLLTLALAIAMGSATVGAAAVEDVPVHSAVEISEAAANAIAPRSDPAPAPAASNRWRPRVEPVSGPAISDDLVAADAPCDRHQRRGPPLPRA